MTPFEQFRATKWFGSLDGLRCLSVVGVIFHHTLGHTFAQGHPLRGAGAHGVTLFFAISGFLITTLMLRERDKHGSISLKNFYVRRSLRIFPLYYTVLAVYAVLVLVMERGSPAGEAFFDNLPAFATYTSNWFVEIASDERVIFYFAWSLATEEQFYLAWPTIEKKARRFAPWIVVIALIASEVVRLGGTPVARGTLEFRVLTSFAPALGLGVLLAHLLHAERSFARVYAVLGHRASAPALAILAVLTLSLHWPLTLLFAVLALLVVACSIREDHGLAWLLRLRPLKEVGVVSYGIYLMHMLAVNVIRVGLRKVGIPASPWLDFVGASVLAFVVAWLSFRYYESRFMAYKHRFSRG